ncbi:ureidoglycolate lyase [Frateuria aurantia]
MKILPLEPLTAEAFAPFGDVIRADAGARSWLINQGSTVRYHDLAKIDTESEGGRTLLNIFRGQPHKPPLQLRMLERHPLGSQAFIPLSTRPYLVVVAPPGPLDEALIRAFLVTDGSGVNYARGCWHHPLLALQDVSDFLVIDRGGPGHNLEEQSLQHPLWLETPGH